VALVELVETAEWEALEVTAALPASQDGAGVKVPMVELAATVVPAVTGVRAVRLPWAPPVVKAQVELAETAVQAGREATEVKAEGFVLRRGSASTAQVRMVREASAGLADSEVQEGRAPLREVKALTAHTEETPSRPRVKVSKTRLHLA
jgi:hypothetical protein